MSLAAVCSAGTMIAGQRHSRACRGQSGERDHRAGPAKPQPTCGGRNREDAERNGGQPGEERDLHDRQAGVEREEDPGAGHGGILSRADQPPRLVTLQREHADLRREHRACHDQRRGEPAREEGAEREADSAERHDRGCADAGQPPDRAAPGGLPGCHHENRGHRRRVQQDRPGGDGGQAGQLTGPPRPGRGGHQVGEVTAAIASGRPGRDACHDRTDQLHLVLHDRAPYRPQGRVPEVVAQLSGREKHAKQRQYPQHRGTPQFQPQQPPRRWPGPAARPQRPGRRRGGGHDRACASTAL